MIKFSQIYTQTKPIISVEIFPPKTEQGWVHLCERMSHLRKYPLDFVSVTYGAGGSTQDRTLDLVQQVQIQVGVPGVPHFTSIGATRERVCAFLDEAVAQGIGNIVALRGDIPANDPNFLLNDRDFRYGNELVAFIHQHTDQLDIAVGGYPEGHGQCPDLAQGIEHLKLKVEAGAAIIITQLFYDNSHFLRFRDRAVQAGINIPIVPGIMPILKFSQIERIVSMCGTTVPTHLRESLLAQTDGSPEQQAIGLDYTLKQSRQLLAEGVPGIHIYSLNNWQAVNQLVGRLQDLVKPRGA